MSECSDENLERAIAGDQVALDRVLLDHYEPLRQHIERQLAPNNQAMLSVDDVIQESYTQVFRDLGTFTPREGCTFLGWVKTIADNRLRDAIRMQKRKKRGGDYQRLFAASHASPFLNDLVEQYATTSKTPSREVARDEAIQAIQVAVAGLPDDHRRILKLRYFEGLSVEETARVVGKTTGAVRGLLDRAKRRIRDSLDNASAYLSTR